MPFIVPVLLSLNAAKNMQLSKSVIRIKYLKNIYYARISSYASIFLFSSLIGI